MARSAGNSRFSALVWALVAAPVALMAQSATTSALTGVVRDPSGKPLAGALVRISSPAMIGGEKTVRTTDNGSYRFAVLPPGQYRLTVEATGHPTLTGSEILELGRTSMVNWRFQAAAVATVEVVAAAGDQATVSVTQNYNMEAVQALPVGRSLTSIMNLTPGVNANAAWGGMRRNNAYLMDGVNVGDPGGATQWIFPNMDWFSEIQVGGVGASAEYGGFTGGYLNAIIKRGGNEFAGNLSAYYGSSKWQANSSNKDPRLTTADKTAVDGKDWDLSFSAGGALIKDKLWYFISAERTQTETTPIGTSQSLKINNKKFLGKVTWQATPSATMDGFIEYDTMDEENRGLDRYTVPLATVKELSPSRSYNLTWTQLFGSDKVLTVKGMGYSGRYDLMPYNGNAIALDALDTYNGKEFYNNANIFNADAEFNYRSRASLSATFDWYVTGGMGSHALKVGLERESSTDESSSYAPGGYTATAYTYSVGGVDLELNPNDVFTGGGYDYKIKMNRTTAFIQDSWSITDRLQVRPGLRFEKVQAGPSGGSDLWSTTTIAPRLGFTFALTEDQSHLLKAHIGRYFEGVSSFWIDRAVKGAYQPEAHYYWGTGLEVLDPLNPSTWPAPPNFAAATPYLRIDDYSAIDPNIKHPYQDEITLSYEAKLGKLWSGGITWIHRENKDMLARVDKAPDPLADTRSFTSLVTGQTIVFNRTGLYGDEHQYLITNDGRAKRNYNSWSLSVERKLVNDWSFSGSYTRARINGNLDRNDGHSSILLNANNAFHSDGLLPGFNDNEVKLRSTYALPFKTQIAATFTYLSGEHWTPQERTRYLGPDGAFRATLFSTPRGSQTYPGRHLLDIRVTQPFTLGTKSKLEIFAEVINALNDCNATAWSTRVGTLNSSYVVVPYGDYKKPTAVDQARNLRVGVRVNF